MNPVADRLMKDHRELDALLRRLADDAAAPEPGALHGTWCLFETQLSRHLDAEERYLLPLLEVTDAEEVGKIRREHARIRDALTELGVAVELHTVRASQVADLVELLETHARSEDGVLYRIAGEKASSAVEQGIARLLKHGAALATAVLAGDGRSEARGRTGRVSSPRAEEKP